MCIFLVDEGFFISVPISMNCSYMLKLNNFIMCSFVGLKENPLGLPPDHRKNYHVNISLSANLDQLSSRLPPGNDFPQERLEEFLDAFLLYLDFKQKEKFNKLLKLRQSQANLPVAQYR